MTDLVLLEAVRAACGGDGSDAIHLGESLLIGRKGSPVAGWKWLDSFISVRDSRHANLEDFDRMGISEIERDFGVSD
ncbi:hypothetical protein [Pseudomonas sp. 31-12]|uniref:hypothetical protein n=1 Tax=Pseudomonas sp. 31-12 TaxID=2201356 RepID=UPI0013A56CA0|nr:hypothetical protein [Pseudomonas sp. 31-12]